MAAQSYRSKLRWAHLLALAAAVGVGLAGSQVLRLGERGEHFWLVFPLLVAACALALLACLPWWRRADDMQKYAHLISWYWGGIAGGTLVVMAQVAAGGRQAELAQSGGMTLLGQFAGFIVFYLVWRVRHGGPTA